MGRSRSLARRGPDGAVTSSPSTSEPVQSINNNMSAVELAPIEATGTTTPSSGLYRSSAAISQPNHPQASIQSAGGGSEAAAEQHVEADGACTSSSGSSHPSTSSAQEGGERPQAASIRVGSAAGQPLHVRQSTRRCPNHNLACRSRTTPPMR